MKRTTEQFLALIEQWLDHCRNRQRVSRNTVAAGIVALDHLRQKCPLEATEVFSSGGELVGARTTLTKTLTQYEIPPNYLKEVTTRQAGGFARQLFELLDWGNWFAGSSAKHRDEMLRAGIRRLACLAKEWLAQQSIRVNCDRQFTPVAWVESILDAAKGRSGGKVEQHLVGAKLQRRFPTMKVPNNPSHAADRQTGRAGDYTLGNTVYHVTSAPGLAVIEKCGKNLAAGLRPMLLVPRNSVVKALNLAEARDLQRRVMVVAIEDFVALNVVEIGECNDAEFLQVFREIIDVYNQRLREVETDLSLQIEID